METKPPDNPHPETKLTQTPQPVHPTQIPPHQEVLPPQEQPLVTGHPDAVIFPTDLPIRGGHAFARLHQILDLADSVLGVNKARGEKSHLCPLPANGGWFVTKDPHNTLLFPVGHDLEKQPRYNWIEQPNRFKFGYLVAAAKEKPNVS